MADLTLSKTYTIQNAYGIHARPAALLVKLASSFTSEVTLEKDGMSVSAKSIMGLLIIEGHQGAEITVSAIGPDAVEAVEAIGELIDAKFNEE